MKQGRLQYESTISSGVDFAASELEQDAGAGLLRYIRTTDVVSQTRLADSGVFVRAELVPTSARVRDGDLLFTRAGSVGTSYLHRGDEAAFAGYLVRCRLRDQHDPRFFAYWAQSHLFWDQVRVGAVRSTIDNFSARKYAALGIPVPRPEVQRRIADYLDAETARIGQLVAKNRLVAELLQERRRSALVQLFHSADRRVPLRYLLAQRPSYGILKPEQVDEGVPVLRIVDVAESGRVRIESAIRVPVEQSQEFARTVLRAGDVVVSVVGTLGRAALVPESAAGANVSRALARLVPGDVDPRWLAGWIRSPEFEWLVDEVTAGTAQRVLNMEDIVAFDVPVFSRSAQAAAVRRLEVIEAEIESAVSALKQQEVLLAERRQTLITAAVTGELAV